MTAARPGLGNATFETAIAIWLQHLTRYPETLIAEAARMLRAGGRFVTDLDKCGPRHPTGKRLRRAAKGHEGVPHSRITPS